MADHGFVEDHGQFASACAHCPNPTDCDGDCQLSDDRHDCGVSNCAGDCGYDEGDFDG